MYELIKNILALIGGACLTTTLLICSFIFVSFLREREMFKKTNDQEY
ncbi:MAG: hypothetical protein RLZZ408_57 [Verrucomicrobiota bacterium]|jgi:hypothetical protein